jgi:hypothetical protein
MLQLEIINPSSRRTYERSSEALVMLESHVFHVYVRHGSHMLDAYAIALRCMRCMLCRYVYVHA